MLPRLKGLNYFHLCALLAFITACTKSGTASLDQRQPTETRHEVYQGPLYHAFQEVQKSKHHEKCDEKLSSIQEILITALEQKNEKLLELLEKHQDQSVAALEPLQQDPDSSLWLIAKGFYLLCKY